MQIDPNALGRRERYQLLTRAFIPRPIAWMSTVSEAGIRNLAPFSFCGAITSDPITVMVSVGRRHGAFKDTAANLMETGEGVLHIAHKPLLAPMVASSADFPPEVDEFEQVGLTPVPSHRVRAPRIAEAAVAMEVVVNHHREIGHGPVDLFLLEVVLVHLAEGLLRSDGIDPGLLSALGRLGGTSYCDTRTHFEQPRPD